MIMLSQKFLLGIFRKKETTSSRLNKKTKLAFALFKQYIYK